MADSMKDKFEDAKDAVAEKFDDAKDAVSDKYNDAKVKVAEKKGEAKAKMSDRKEQRKAESKLLAGEYPSNTGATGVVNSPVVAEHDSTKDDDNSK